MRFYEVGRVSEQTTAYLGLGSNVGHRLANLRAAVEQIDASPSARVTKRSAVYESKAEGPLQPDYFNMVIEVKTKLDPNGLLSLCQKVEDSLGRIRVQRWGPRTIDVDILLFGELIVDQDQPRLEIPHPRMWTREFVCVPLAEIAPADLVPDPQTCLAGRIVRKVGDLYETSKAKGA